jgi:hypothetical protein
LAVSARLVISEDRKRVARAFNDIGWRNAVMKWINGEKEMLRLRGENPW